jgi:hypothetical protein
LFWVGPAGFGEMSIVQSKAERLLCGNSVIVTSVGEGRVEATVTGDHGVYVVRWHGEWSCECAAWRECSHVAAVKLVTAADLGAG